jgi:hypothetical protein
MISRKPAQAAPWPTRGGLWLKTTSERATRAGRAETRPIRSRSARRPIRGNPGRRMCHRPSTRQAPRRRGPSRPAACRPTDHRPTAHRLTRPDPARGSRLGRGSQRGSSSRPGRGNRHTRLRVGHLNRVRGACLLPISQPRGESSPGSWPPGRRLLCLPRLAGLSRVCCGVGSGSDSPPLSSMRCSWPARFSRLP